MTGRTQLANWMMMGAPLLLAGCGGITGSQTGPAIGFIPATRPPAASSGSNSGGVIGNDARSLVRLFGQPRLDIRDPAARKLQFANQECVLDAYLYPPATGREPVVEFVDARAVSGSPMAWQDCARRLQKH